MSTTMAARAEDAPTRQQVYLVKLQTANAIAAARYGAPATPTAGTVSGGESLAAMALLLEPDAYETVAADIAKRAPGKDRGILITTKADVAGLVASARLVQERIDSMIKEGESLAASPPDDKRKFGAAIGLPAMMAVAGAVDSIVGLFRTDYTVSSTELDANLLGLQLAIQRSMGGRARIDGLALFSVTSEFEKRVFKLDEVRETLASQNPAENSPKALFIAAADKVLESLRTLSDAGVAPAARIGLLLEQTRDLDAVLYVNVVKPTGTAVTTRRLFSLNRKVHLHLTGLVNTVYQTSGGAPDSKTYRLGESATLDLRDLERHSHRPFTITTE